MSLTIIKSGVLDTIQDRGRYGYQGLGINPGGAIDRFSASLSNCLLGKHMSAPVVEMHYPAPIIIFNKAAIICISGANFCPEINGETVPLHQPIVINRNTTLEWKQKIGGMRSYLSVLQPLYIDQWLESYSTNVKAEAGGYNGRSLKAGDTIEYDEDAGITNYLQGEHMRILPWNASPNKKPTAKTIDFITGPEWDNLSEDSMRSFINQPFAISKFADRMGYRLLGSDLEMHEPMEIISSGVGFGTIQLLPNKQLIILMSDHQTTGGYPRIASVVSADLPVLAQMKPTDKILFNMSDIETAERKLLQQHQYLLSVQYASSFRIHKLFV